MEDFGIKIDSSLISTQDVDFVGFLLSPYYRDDVGNEIPPPSEAFESIAEYMFPFAKDGNRRRSVIVYQLNDEEIFSVEFDGRIILRGELIGEI